MQIKKYYCIIISAYTVGDIIMRPQKPFPLDTVEKMERLLESSVSVAEYRRIQSVYLRAKYGYDAEQIAEMVGLRLQTVRSIHSAFLRNGEASLRLSGKGGRRNFYLDDHSESAFLAELIKESESIYMRIETIHAAYCKKVGKEVALTTTHRMLHRHGWRKVFGSRSGRWTPPQK
jgi:transposase